MPLLAAKTTRAVCRNDAIYVLRRQWLAKCRRPATQNKQARVCSLHFKKDDCDNFLQYDSGLASKLILKPLQSLNDGHHAFGVRIEEQNRVGCEAYAPFQAVTPVRSGADPRHQKYF